MLIDAGIEDGAVQCAPVFGELGSDGIHVVRLAQVARQHQYPTGKTLGQRLQGFLAACAQSQQMPFFQQALGQGMADATAGTGQPDAPAERAHDASLAEGRFLKASSARWRLARRSTMGLG